MTNVSLVVTDFKTTYKPDGINVGHMGKSHSNADMKILTIFLEERK